MISIRKLTSLPGETRRRKSLMLIRDCEQLLMLSSDKQSMNTSYLRGLLKTIQEDKEWPLHLRQKAHKLFENLTSITNTTAIHRDLNNLRHLMLTALGQDWADWNMQFPRDGFPAPEEAEPHTTWPIRVYLDGLRSPFNVGSIARTSQAFGVEQIWLSPECTSLEHKRAQRSAMGAAKHISWSVKTIDEIPSEETSVVFALEHGGVEIEKFSFPNSGTILLGSEELGLSPKAMDIAKGGIVSIPLSGFKSSLNVGIAFGILIQHWTQALKRDQREKQAPS